MSLQDKTKPQAARGQGSKRDGDRPVPGTKSWGHRRWARGAAASLAQASTGRLSIPTIGISAGVQRDGQVLVWCHLLDLFDRPQPKFAKRFAHLAPVSAESLRAYHADVAALSFPLQSTP